MIFVIFGPDSITQIVISKAPIIMKSLLSRQAIRIISLLFILPAIALSLISCSGESEKEGGDIVPVHWSGVQIESGFFIHVFIYEAEGRAVVVNGALENRSGDTETLSYSKTDNGFVLCDNETKAVLYTAVFIDSFHWKMKLFWNHSPGPVWEEYAEERGWESEMVITRESEPDDIRY